VVTCEYSKYKTGTTVYQLKHILCLGFISPGDADLCPLWFKNGIASYTKNNLYTKSACSASFHWHRHAGCNVQLAF